MAKLNGKKKATLYDLFHKNPLAGKGVSKTDTLERNFKNFFKLSWWHMGSIVSVNLLFLIGNFPVFFGLLGMSGLLTTSMPNPSTITFPNLFGAMSEGGNPITATLYGVYGIPSEMAIPNTATNVMMWLTLLLFLTWGFTNIGTTYIVRNLVKGDPVFLFHDFFYAIKRNWLQGLIMGILDLLLIVLFVAGGIISYISIMPYYWYGPLLFYLSGFLAFIYMNMRFYIYSLIITFDLPLHKVLKNAFILAGVAMKRNALGFFSIAGLVILEWALIKYITPLGIILPLIFLYGYCAYIGSYVSWPKIKELMVDPYEENKKQDAPIEEAPIFSDDVE